MYDEPYIEVPPHMVNYINRIIEGYEYLGVLTTNNAKRSTCVVHTTKNTKEIAIAVLKSLTEIPIAILKNKEDAK